MLQDDMGILKKEVQAMRAEVSDAVVVANNVDSRFHMLESEMRGFWKKMKDDEAVKAEKAAVGRLQTPAPVCGLTRYLIML